MQIRRCDHLRICGALLFGAELLSVLFKSLLQLCEGDDDDKELDSDGNDDGGSSKTLWMTSLLLT